MDTRGTAESITIGFRTWTPDEVLLCRSVLRYSCVMGVESNAFKRKPGIRSELPANASRETHFDSALMAFRTVWGKSQPLQWAAGANTRSEFSLIRTPRDGVVGTDSAMPDSKAGVATPDAVSVAHDQIREPTGQLDPPRINMFPRHWLQSPLLAREMSETVYPFPPPGLPTAASRPFLVTTRDDMAVRCTAARSGPRRHFTAIRNGEEQ